MSGVRTVHGTCLYSGRVRCLVAVAPVLLLFGLGASSVQAQVRLDPNSPAGVEYQLPLERARDEAAGGATRGPRSDEGGGSAGDATAGATRSQLFGLGIQGPDKKRRGAGATAGKAGASSADGGSPGISEKAGRVAVASRAVERGAHSTIPITVAIAAGLVLLGGGTGLVLRRALGRSE
jgi:hypothetical protein